MSGTIRFGIAISIFLIVAIVIAYINYWKTYHKFLNPWELIKNIWRGLLIFFKSFLGIPARGKETAVAGDRVFMNVPEALHNQALIYAFEQMIDAGIVYTPGDEKRTVKEIGRHIGYALRLFDCENFAHALKHYYDVYIARNTTACGKGIPSMVIGYIDSKRGDHSIVQFVVDDETIWRDCYPISGGFKQLHLTISEQATITPMEMG